MTGEALLVAPQNLEAEEAVLGAILLEPRMLAAVRPLLRPGDFYRPSHGDIYRAMLELDDAGTPADPLLVIDRLDSTGRLEDAGGKIRVHELAALVPGALRAPHWAALVGKEAQRRRELQAVQAAAAALGNGGLSDEQRARVVAVLSAAPMGRPTAHLEPLELSTFLAGEPPAVAWLWHRWLARGDLALVVGDPGVGKSLLALALADAVRRGGLLLGEPCQRARVGIFDLENPEGEAHKRLRAFGLTAEDHDGLAYFHAPALDLGQNTGRAMFADALDRHELDLAIIDSLRRAAPGLEENDSAKVSAVLSPLRALTATSGRTIVLLHHARKRSADTSTDAGQMVRGSGDLVASVDSLLFLRAKESDSFTLEHAKARRGRPHAPILVRLAEHDDDRLELVNEGELATADDKVEAMLARITTALADAGGGPLERQVLALRVGSQGNDGTYTRALKLGWQRSQLARTDRTSDPSRKVTDPTLYALPPEVLA